MNIFLALLGLLLVMGGWTWYLALIPAEKVPQRPVAHIIVIVIGMALSIGVAIIELTVLTVVTAVVSLTLGGFFLWLLTQAALPDSKIAISVGDPLPVFTAADDANQPITSTQWQGQRILFKFFRGQW